MCFGPFGRLLAVQTTTKTNMKAREKKIRASKTFPLAVEQNISVVVHGWHKKKGKWEVEILDLS